MERGQFTFYRSFWEAAKEIEKPQDRLSYLEAIIAFALDGEEREVTKKARSSYILSKPTLLSSAKKARAGKLGGDAKQTGSKTEANGKQNAIKTEANGKQNAIKTEANGKQSGSEKEKEKEIEIENECLYSANTRFVRPTVEQVREYVAEMQYHVDADAFVSWYTANGWKVGKNPMKDWKAAVRTWERKDMERNGIGNKPKYQPGNQPSGSDRPAPTRDDVERMKRFLAKMKGEENETENVG